MFERLDQRKHDLLQRQREKAYKSDFGLLTEFLEEVLEEGLNMPGDPTAAENLQSYCTEYSKPIWPLLPEAVVGIDFGHGRVVTRETKCPPEEQTTWDLGQIDALRRNIANRAGLKWQKLIYNFPAALSTTQN